MKGITALLLFVSIFGFSQDPHRFANEIKSIEKKYDTVWNSEKETIVFTGSSSIRKWEKLKQRFPTHQIVNTGFGGSEASDLLYYSNELIHRFQPLKVFIYEGDNDINSKKKTKQILKDIKEIIAGIQNKNIETKIVLIAAKPSIARWRLKRKYKQLNRRFKKLSKTNTRISYADVWTPMLDGKKLKKDIFIADGLHLNEKGYQIWYQTIKEFIAD